MNNCFRLLLFIFICFSSLCHANEKTIGLQLYSLRDDINSMGIEKVLDKVAKIGYNTIEIAGYEDGQIYGIEPKKFKKIANKKGLEVTSSHLTGFFSNNLKADINRWEDAIKDHAKIGVKYLVISTLPWWGKTTYSKDDVNKVVDYFNKIGKIASKNGMTFCFHNHNHEFNIKVDGKDLYSILLKKLNPKYVAMQMDVYWVNEAGHNPISYLKKYKGYFPLLHIKDDNVIGDSGKLNFKKIFNAAYEQGMEAFFVEVENYKKSPLQDVKESYKYLKNAEYVK